VNGPVVLVRLSRVKTDALRDLLYAASKFVSAQNPRKRLSKHRKLR
jgi:hypothetical protein